MATNNNGHLLDDKGNVVVDFVWGNFPLQPNDEREDGKRLDFSLDNHVLAQTGWNGYPLYVPNTDGAAIEGDSPADGIQADEIFIVVPNVLGLTSALATDALKDAGFATVNATTGTTAKALTRINVTSTTAATVYLTSGSTYFSVGSRVRIGAGTGIPAALVNTTTGWEVTGSNGTTVTIKGTGWTVADTGTIAPAATVTGASGTVTFQNPLVNAASIASGGTASTLSWA